MTARAKTTSAKAPLVIALTVLVMLLASGPVNSFYAPAGAKPTGNSVDPYMNPNDGMCIVGVAADGTMLVDWSITNARDCAAYTESADTSVNLAGMTAVDVTATSTCGATGTASCGTSTGCTRPNGSVVWNNRLSQCQDISSCVIASGTAPNDGYKHAWSSSICYDAGANKGISRLDLDNTNAMCVSKGGAVVETGKCVAYGWVYRNRKSDGPPPTLPISGTGISTTDGVQATDNLGFCYTAIRMTGGSYTSSTCPSFHNSPTNNAAEWPACGSSATGCQTQVSYDAGLGWSFSSPNCVYAFGLQGTSSANVTNAAGVATPAGSAVNPSQYTNQGDCLAAGFSWDNWLPSAGTTTKTNADGGDYAGMPAGAVIRKLNALTQDLEGPSDFYSGTGFNCLRCHSDQSRAYQERDKPGLVKSRHLRAGDDLSKPFSGFFTLGSSSWGLQGVQCAMCHSTARPARDDLIQVIPIGTTGAGNPKSATGHNQTEYGAHLLDICYTCHGSHTDSSTNPAAAIPVSGGDFALTANTPGPPVSNLSTPPSVGGLAPIMNQFLNSPHAKYGAGTNPPASATGLKVDIGDKRNYGSTFEGYVCRTAADNLNRTLPTQTACQNAGYHWYTTAHYGNICYYDATSCAAPLTPTGQWTTTFDATAYPFAADTGGPGGVCYGVGIGNIATTVYRNGAAEKIPNVDSITNPACTNSGNGSSTSGAAGFWVKDGETSTGSNGDTAQGNCMTCHDVHWALADTDPEAEPFRRECPTCHVNSGTSASGAPQIDLATINHLKTAGTPLENWQTDPAQACEICHMPKSGGSSSSFMHLWRINTDPTYHTMGATQANLAPADDYAGAAWVDLDHACGQCHGGDSGSAKPGVPFFTTGELSLVAQGMHNSAGVSYQVTFGIVTNGLTVTVTPIVDCGGTCPALTYHWDFGDGTTDDTADPNPTDQHTYASGGSKSITLTVLVNGQTAGSATRSVTISTPNPAPTAAGTCEWTPETWTLKYTDSSTGGTPPLQIVVRWGDSSGPTITTQNGVVSHTYLTNNDAPYTATLTAIDAKLRKAVTECAPVTPARFQITGTVLGNSPVANALVKLKKGATLVKYVYTPANGTFTLKNVKPGAYTLRVVSTGFTFPPTPITVGPDSLNNVITGTPQ